LFDKKCLVNLKSVNHFPKTLDARRIRPLLNDIVDLHVQVVDHHRNLVGTEIRQHLVNVTEIRPTQIPATKLDVFWPSSRIPVGWPDKSSQKIPAGSLPTGRDLAILRLFCAGFRQFWPESGHFCRNLTNPDSNETIRIPAFISNSSYSSRNPVKVVGILLVNDEISSPVIFILFYINIYMF
jgi:hypothetical protein